MASSQPTQFTASGHSPRTRGGMAGAVVSLCEDVRVFMAPTLRRHEWGEGWRIRVLQLQP